MLAATAKDNDDTGAGSATENDDDFVVEALVASAGVAVGDSRLRFR